MNVQHVVDNELERQRLARLVVRNRVEQERAMERRRAEEEEEEEKEEEETIDINENNQCQ